MTSQGWQHSVAGGVAGSAAVLLLHPFDVIKTRLQVQDGHQGQLLGSYQGSLHAVRTMLQREGWRVFYNGLIPALIGSGVSWSAYFTAYEAIKSLHARGLPAGERAPAWTNTTSAAAAGGMVCLVTNPIWLIKTRLQLQNSTLTVRSLATPALAATATTAAPATPAAPASTTASVGRTPTASSASTSGIHPPATPAAASSQPPSASGRGPAAAAGSAAGRQYKGFIDAFVNIGRQEGWRGYYKGLGPSLVLQTTHGAIQFTVYEEFKHAATRWGASSAQSPDRRITSWETSLAAAASKLTASVVTYPSQVVRSRLQQRFDLGRTRSYHSAWEVIRLTWRGEGVRGFYKGLGPALVRVLPQSAVTLVVYENILQILTDQSPKLKSARTD